MFINKRARAVGVSRAAWRPLRPREDLPIFAKEGRGVPLGHGQASRQDRVMGSAAPGLTAKAPCAGEARHATRNIGRRHSFKFDRIQRGKSIEKSVELPASGIEVTLVGSSEEIVGGLRLG